ncbi:hypothetical protein J1N35_041877 [Gossypium stocksii]|uniref:Uncharacterized protein n=1 Tax=Gossypium stocksii TaxID=47602 RepID=A0A9D3UGQ2_9ROSI|nr:hypothetical protein J1N35_041877 [Gossypium stocksii]
MSHITGTHVSRITGSSIELYIGKLIRAINQEAHASQLSRSSKEPLIGKLARTKYQNAYKSYGVQYPSYKKLGI